MVVSHGDGAPARVHAEYLVPKPFWKLESLSKSKIERGYRVECLRRQLAKLDQVNPRPKAIQKVLNALARCRKGERCGSLACPVCMRNKRGPLVHHDMLVVWPDQPEVLAGLKALTLVHEDWIISAGKLDTLCPHTIIDKLRKQFQRMGFTGMVIGGIDGSFDADLYQPA